MKKMTNLSSNMAPGDVFKKQLMMIYGTEFQREITLNNSQSLSILIISTDKTTINQLVLDKTHSLEPQDILKQPIKLNLFPVSTLFEKHQNYNQRCDFLNQMCANELTGMEFQVTMLETSTVINYKLIKCVHR